MNRYKVTSNAKINIGLNVYDKDNNGYHYIDTIMLPITLEDELEILIFEKKGNLNIVSSDNKVPTDEKNILFKVYNKYFEKINQEKIEISIFLKKIIPMEAGLGGGSSNAATFLKVLNEYYDNYFLEDELLKIAFEIGSDVPFFIKNEISRVSGNGEKIKKINNKFYSSIVLIKPDFGISTKEAYLKFDELKQSQEIKYCNLDEIEKVLSGLNINYSLIEKNIENSLEQALDNNINVKFLKDSLKSILPNKKFFMSGSGSTFYSFISENEIDFIETRLKTFLDNVKIIICNIKK